MNIKPLQGAFLQSDGTIDEAVLCIVAGTAAMIVFEALDIASADFKPLDFGAGMAALWGGAGALMKFRPQTPPA